jgi:DHA3 family macrolide efflux protein-like MFS transporter
MSQIQPSQGWRVFGIVWGGQLVSLVGSGLTSFVLGLWVLQRTQSVTQFALIL